MPNVLDLFMVIHNVLNLVTLLYYMCHCVSLVLYWFCNTANSHSLNWSARIVKLHIYKFSLFMTMMNG